MRMQCDAMLSSSFIQLNDYGLSSHWSKRSSEVGAGVGVL